MVKFLRKILNKVTNEKILEDTILESTKKEAETQTTILEKKAGVYKKPKETKSDYVGVPAPKVLKDDAWFGPAVISDSNKDYMEREYEAFKEEAHKHYGTDEKKEPDNIHEVMYQIATESMGSWQENIGGSENFNNDSNQWSSGTGMGQYR